MPINSYPVLQNKFDLIFFDPPYASKCYLWLDDVAKKILAPQGIIYLESSKTVESNVLKAIKHKKTNRSTMAFMNKLDKILYPGSFDPITLGMRISSGKPLGLASTVIVAVAKDNQKTSLFTSKQRVLMLEAIQKTIQI